MDVSKYKSVGEWRDALIAQGWSIGTPACWALSRTMDVLGLSIQEAMDFLVRNEKLAFSGRTVLTDLSFQTLLEEVKMIKRAYELPSLDGERISEETQGAILEDSERSRREKKLVAGIKKIALFLAYLIVVSGITYVCIRKRP